MSRVRPALGAVVGSLVLTALLLGGCATAPPPLPVMPKPHFKIGQPYRIGDRWYRPQMVDRYETRGVASWYGQPFHGRLTANGELFDMFQLTAAHPTLPLPSIVRVTNLENRRTIVVRVNDRGPFAKDRVIDLSYQAARILGFANQGTTEVHLEYLGLADLEVAGARGLPVAALR